MNEQQLQQILTIQQAIAAAATAAMLNTLLNPQQAAANLVNNQNTLSESPTSPNADFQDRDPQDNNQLTPTTPSNIADHHLHHQQRQDNQVAASIAAASASATSSNMMIAQAASHSPNNHSNKKLKRHNQAPQAFPRQHSSPSSSSAFLPNNVGLPRKLVRGQDVWLGRGAEQTRQILKCMWCNQSFRTLAEMTHHMKMTQHYTNIISQEQITSWKQPENSDVMPSGRQQSKQSISTKNLDEFHETTSQSEKSIDSEREDIFSNDDGHSPSPPPQKQSRTKTRPERTATNNSNNSNNSKNNNNNSTPTTTTAATTPPITTNNDDLDNKITEQQPTDADPDADSEDEQETNDENKCKRESTSREKSQDNNDDCDKKPINKKRPREDDSDVDASTTNTDISAKQDPDGQKEVAVNENGDPLSALETMVEKSFDPRMRPGVASGGILQRLGIDEEVCPPWQHINYANWYAAAAYGHPMAAALLAAGINLQNGIKLSKNIGSKKSDD